MLFIDYVFEVGPTGTMMFDRELTLDKLKWAEGDKFEVKLFNGRIVLYKLNQGVENGAIETDAVSSTGTLTFPVL